MKLDNNINIYYNCQCYGRVILIEPFTISGLHFCNENCYNAWSSPEWDIDWWDEVYHKGE